ncbi:hypothetical protein [Aeromonas caviae]|uniref:hypothetical protein n=1 Tax=Aeromonas caviae TaxID=648 RepID=UPI002B489BCA|nr:hypothetical protein [Aeromonas caviae]
MLGLSTVMQGFLGGALAISFPLAFNLVKEIIFDKRKRREEQAYISVQLVFQLDKFVARCADVAWDRGYDPFEMEPDESELVSQTQIPTFDISNIKGEHKYLKPEMLAKLHSIEIKLNQANEALHDEDCSWLYGGPRGEFFELRRKYYGEVGLYAASIAKELRNEFNIETAHGWVPSEKIHQSIIDLEEIKADRDERIQQRKIERERRKTEEDNGQNDDSCEQNLA